MKPCIHCGGEGKLIDRFDWHAIMANRMPAFGRSFSVNCSACKCSTRSYDRAELATQDWNTGLAGFPERGFG